MKLLQLNIWGGRLMHSIKETITRQSPDIICLQEVFSTEGEGLVFNFNNLEVLKEFLPEYHCFYAPVLDVELLGKPKFFGNAIFSKFPITKKETVFTSLDYKSQFSVINDDYNIRNFHHAEIKMDNGKTIHVLNHHGYHIPDHKDGNDLTLSQMEKMLNYTKDLKGPIIIAGDFNLGPKSESINVLNQQFDNLCVSHEIETTRNEFTSKSEVCDYIFINDNVSLQNFEVLPDLVSDHAALTVEFDI